MIFLYYYYVEKNNCKRTYPQYSKIRRDNWGKNVKVIILPNLSHPDKEQEVKELGVEDYIVKADWKLENVVKLIESKLQQQS